MSAARVSGLRTSRIEGLSDGVFAIAMTILILTFENILQSPVEMDEKTLMKIIVGLLPDLLHYIESFVILGVFWFQHHQQFHYIKKADVTLLFIDIAGLMAVSLIPFTSVMVSDYGHMRIAALLFECNMLIAGLIFFVHWLYASAGHRLVETELDERVITFYIKRNLVIPLTSLAAIGMCFINPRLSTVLYFFVPVILFFWAARTRNTKEDTSGDEMR